MLRNTTLAVLSVLGLAAASVQAAPIVTMTETTLGGFKSLDFYYTASAGAEFTNYRLVVQSLTGVDIQDPVKANTSDKDADAVDTFANTVYSLYGLGPASYTFNAYKPVGIPQGSPPVSLLDWSVFDTGAGDTNSFDAGPPYNQVSAPFHLARVLMSLTGRFNAVFTAFDSNSNGVPTVFNFPPLPEPASLTLLGIAIGGFGSLRRRAA